MRYLRPLPCVFVKLAMQLVTMSSFDDTSVEPACGSQWAIVSKISRPFLPERLTESLFRRPVRAALPYAFWGVFVALIGAFNSAGRRASVEEAYDRPTNLFLSASLTVQKIRHADAS